MVTINRTFAEIEAQLIFEKIHGLNTQNTGIEGANYVLALAERIKNERTQMILSPDWRT